MKLEESHKAGWLVLPNPERKVARQPKPAVLSLEQAVAWIRQHRPILWLGSAISVPDPSGLPSGAAITESVLDAVFPEVREFPDILRPGLFATLVRRWPLEALFDEFEILDFDLSNSFLEFFSGLSAAAQSNALHRAAVTYYAKGYASAPVCVTTNWDNLLESAFRAQGFDVRAGGPNQRHDYLLKDAQFCEKGTVVYHPHGSFEGRDVVCSLQQESRQLDVSIDFVVRPTLFLGYSGYEPSLYGRLEHDAGQLWCVKAASDFDIPAKRRLLSRPGTFVYIGDICELLLALAVLEAPVDISSNAVALPELPERLRCVVQEGLLASSDVNLCVEALSSLLPHIQTEPPFDRAQLWRLISLARAVVNHMRDRSDHDSIPGLINTIADKFNVSRLRLGVLGYGLRQSPVPDRGDMERLVASIVGEAEEGAPRIIENFTYHQLTKLDQFYKEYVYDQLRPDKRTARNTYGSLLMLGDLAAAGECLELAGFAHLREGNEEIAANVFDSAATAYYLRGLWNAGYLNELAAQNVTYLRDVALRGSLMM